MRSFSQKVSGFVLTFALIFFLAQHSQAQVDSTAAKKDTVPVTKKDTVPVTTQPAPTESTPTTTSEHKTKRFVIYAGPNYSSLRQSGDEIKDESQAGWHVGLSWRSTGFFFSQFGVKYNSPSYSIRPATSRDSGDYKFAVNSLDFPLTFGINLLPGTDRLLSLRGFISAIPSFNLGVGDNDYNYDTDKIETFNFAGSVGIGIDVLFMVFEIGYNHGFSDLLKDTESKPGQGFINIGFRF